MRQAHLRSFPLLIAYWLLIQIEPVRFDQNQFGPDRLGPDHFGPVQFEPIH
jgi:hypothetical protein